MSWFRSRKDKPLPALPSYTTKASTAPMEDLPPSWTPAPQQSHDFGLYNEATIDEYESAELFCSRNPLERPRLLSSHMVERINIEGCRAWSIEVPHHNRFVGKVVDEGEKGGGEFPRWVFAILLEREVMLMDATLDGLLGRSSETCSISSRVVGEGLAELTSTKIRRE